MSPSEPARVSVRILEKEYFIACPYEERSALLDSPERRQMLESQARRTVESRFGWDAIAGEQRQMYAELLAK